MKPRCSERHKLSSKCICYRGSSLAESGSTGLTNEVSERYSEKVDKGKLCKMELKEVKPRRGREGNGGSAQQSS